VVRSLYTVSLLKEPSVIDLRDWSTEPMDKEDLVSLANKRLSDWNTRAGLWYSMYYLFGGLAVLLTITVASRPHFIPTDVDWLATLAWLAAIFQGLNTFLVALPKATAYRAAWRTLWLARLDYVNSDKSEAFSTDLKHAITRGWAIIDGGYTDAFKADPSRAHVQKGDAE